MSGSCAVGANYVEFTAGSASAAGTGAMSMLALVNPGVGNNNAGFIAGYASATMVRGVGESSLHLYSPNDFSSGFGTLTQGNWYLAGVSKSSGTVPWRHHLRQVGGAWSHGNSVGAGNQGNGSALTNFRFGASGIASANGLYAAWACWTSELADAAFDAIDDSTLQSWANQSPQELIELSGWNGSTGAVIYGTSTQSSVVGTVSSGANPAGFNFAIGGASMGQQLGLTQAF